MNCVHFFDKMKFGKREYFFLKWFRTQKVKIFSTKVAKEIIWQENQ